MSSFSEIFFSRIPERAMGRQSIVNEICVFLNTLQIYPFAFLLELERRSIP
jgi:hypothetical protein